MNEELPPPTPPSSVQESGVHVTRSVGAGHLPRLILPQ